MEDQIYVDIAKVASIYRGLRSYKRLVQMYIIIGKISCYDI